MGDVIEVSRSGGRVDLVLNRPEVLNAMSWAVFEALGDAVDEIGSLPDARVVVVSGRGRSFCSGIDTGAFGELQGDPAANIARAQSGFRKLAALGLPTIAAIRGHALGAGLQLALACDLRVVTRDASLGLLEAKYGIVPDLGGTGRLPALVGPARAKRMIWLAERVDGDTAEMIGLADAAVDGDALDGHVDALADTLCGAPPIVVREVKHLVDRAAGIGAAEAMDAEAVAQERALSSADFGEAITAFVERRPPVFTGR